VTAEASTSFQDAWRRFQEAATVQVGLGVERMSGCTGRALFLAFVVRVLEREVRAAIASFVEGLRDIPCLDLYPGDYWHITVKMVGFQVIKRTRPDEVLPGEVGPMIRAAERAVAGQEPFQAEIGPVNAFSDAVFLEVHDGGRLKALHQQLVEALTRCPRFPHDGDLYLPHLTLARYASQDGLGKLKERLTALRSQRLGTLAVQRVELVKVWLRDERRELDVVRPIELGRAR
jgi:2'-5' RNA ligase